MPRLLSALETGTPILIFQGQLVRESKEIEIEVCRRRHYDETTFRSRKPSSRWDVEEKHPPPPPPQTNPDCMSDS